MIHAGLLGKMRGVLPLFMSAHFTHHLCTGTLIPLLPLLRNQFDLSYFRSGLLVSAFGIAYGLSQLPLGSLADRVNKRLLIPLGLLGVALTTIGISLAPNYYQVLILLILMGLFGGTYHPAAAPLLSQYFPQKSRGGVLGIHLVGGSASFLLTPVLAGLLAQLAGWRAAFLLLALPALLSGLAFWGWLKDPSPSVETATPKSRADGPRMGELLRLLGALIAIAMVSQLVSSGINSFLPIYLVDKHSVPATYAAMLVGLVAGAGILGSPAGGMISDRIGRKPVIFSSVVASGPLIYLLTISPFGPGLIAIFILFGLAMTSRMPVIESFIIDVVPLERRSTVFGIYLFLGMEAGGASATVVGFLSDRLGLNMVFTILAFMAIASSALVLLMRKKI